MAKLLSIIALLLLTATKLKASCCSQAGAGGAGRLLAHERALVELSSKGAYTFGGFLGPKFSWGKKSPNLAFEQNLHIMTRLADYFMPFVHLPVVIKKSDDAVGGGLGDIVVGARSNILPENYFAHWPSIAMINGVKIPTGRKSTKDWPRKSEDITSAGEWQGFLGLVFEKQLCGITYGLGYTLGLEPNRLSHALSFSGNFLLHESGTMGVSLSPVFYGALSQDGQKLLESAQRKITVAATYALKVHSKLTLSINAGSDVPIDHLGKDHNTDFFIKLAMRLGVF